MSKQSTDTWRAWKPTSEQPWSLRRVWHLHRRAGFAATWSELRRDLHEGVDSAIERFLAADTERHAIADFKEVSDTIGSAAASSGNPDRLKAWWVYRMLYSPDPLTERLTLMWHNHFATSNQKVGDVALMWQQNQLMREHARGSFGDLLTAVVKHPAMLIWLDATANRSQHPNENLARELMELFTLGVGHYSEADVKESARCLTGWAASRSKFRIIGEYHDDGEKTVLAQTGRFDGDDLIDVLLDHPETANRLAWRLCDTFLGEGVATGDDIAALGVILTQHHLNIASGVETILRSQLFFSEANLGSRIAGPADFMIGAARALELSDPRPSTLSMAKHLAIAGQDLFYPPNVFGWTGGRTWINTRSVLARANYATALVAGDIQRPRRPLRAAELAARGNRKRGLDGLTKQDAEFSFFADLLFGLNADDEMKNETLNSLRGLDDASAARQIVQQLLTSPEGQLC